METCFPKENWLTTCLQFLQAQQKYTMEGVVKNNNLWGHLACIEFYDFKEVDFQVDFQIMQILHCFLAFYIQGTAMHICIGNWHCRLVMDKQMIILVDPETLTNFAMHRGRGLVLSALDFQSLALGSMLWMKVCLSFSTCVNKNYLHTHMYMAYIRFAIVQSRHNHLHTHIPTVSLFASAYSHHIL